MYFHQFYNHYFQKTIFIQRNLRIFPCKKDTVRSYAADGANYLICGKFANCTVASSPVRIRRSHSLRTETL